MGGMRSGPDWISPTSLPFNHLVDRSLCSEYQLLSRVCEELAGAVSGEAWRATRGWLWLFVTGAPCLSCVGAMRQFQLLLPKVEFAVTIGDEVQCDALCARAR